ncbi:MAG: class I SAM-dependent methyltransferase [Tannerella sp.]|jgi:hypothetical protein|nr:class I SAM-dependent methyltransferase [Tannerella sp.]
MTHGIPYSELTGMSYFCRMKVSEDFFSFVRAHAADDLSQLLLSAGRYPGIDVPFAVEQIAARRNLRGKLPLWEADGRLLFPSRTAAEQCSSELAARYKLQLLEGENHLCDLTGGLGVDSYYFARQTARVTYVECDATCFDTAMYNFERLNVKNIVGFRADAREVLDEIPAADVFYVDPARRVTGNTRVFALHDCMPDLSEMLPGLLRRAPKVIAKLSPMLDIRHTRALLSGTSEIHVVAVRNECRELLFVVRRGTAGDDPAVHCVNFTSDGGAQTFRFRRQEERSAENVVCNRMLGYLYEPNASILKAGAYKLVASRMSICKLHVSSHLYTSDEYLPSFPGRIFRVERVFPFNNAVCRTIARTVPQANVSTRNFPLSVDELCKRLRVAGGGDAYLFATTLADNGKVLILCRKTA